MKDKQTRERCLDLMFIKSTAEPLNDRLNFAVWGRPNFSLLITNIEAGINAHSPHRQLLQQRTPSRDIILAKTGIPPREGEYSRRFEERLFSPLKRLKGGHLLILDKRTTRNREEGTSWKRTSPKTKNQRVGQLV